LQGIFPNRHHLISCAAVPTRIAAQGVQELMSAGATVVEVLPRTEYTEQHLPGALGIPLKELDAGRVADIDPDAPVVVYCWDSI
jgi:phage shock protein E